VGDGGELVDEMAGIAISCEEVEVLLQNLEDEQEVLTACIDQWTLTP
jgi:hypothetical protein